MPETTVHCGLWHSELEPQLISQIQSIKLTDPLQPIVVMIGSRLLADYLTWHLNDLEINCFNLHFVTVAGLAGELGFRDKVRDQRPELPPFGEKVAIAALLDEMGHEHYFEDYIGQSGIVNSLENSFHDLDHAGINDLAQFNSVYLQSDKFKTLAKLRNDCLKLLSGFRRPIEDLSMQDSGSRFETRFGTDLLHIYSLYDFSQLQMRFIRNLAERITIKVYLPFSHDCPAFKYADKGQRFFKSLPSSKILHLKASSNIFSHSQLLFSPQTRTDGATRTAPKVTLFNGNDKIDEISGIVARISEMVLYDHVKPESIGIMLWQPADYLLPLKDALNQAQIPYADMIGSGLNHSKEGRAVSQLISLVKRKLKRKEVIDFLSSNDVILAEEDDPVMWEKISVDAGIVEADRIGWENSLRRCKDNYGYKFKNAPETAYICIKQTEALQQFITDLFDCFDLFPNKGSWTELNRSTVRLVKTFIPQSDTTDQIIEIVRELNDLDGIAETVNRHDYFDTVIDALDSVNIGKGRYAVDGVTICDRMTARFVKFDVLFIPGLVQGSIPVIPREDPILTDRERTELNKQFGKELLSSKLARIEEEKLLFAIAVDSARERLYLSYPRGKIGGGTLRVSRFLLEMCKVVSGRPLTVEQIHQQPFFERKDDSNVKYFKRLTHTNGYIEQWIKNTVPEDARLLAYHELYRDSGQYIRSIRTIQSRKSGKGFTPWDGMIESGWNRPADMTHSASSLQQYASCPFRYMIQRIFRAEEWEEPEQLLTPVPQDVGTVIHRILQQLYVNARQNEMESPNSNLNWYLTKLDQIIDSMSGWIRRLWQVPKPVYEMELQFIRNRLKRFIEQESDKDDGFLFETAEMSIDRKIVIESADDSIVFHLKGQIDRIDFSTDRHRMRIIDYKTGKNKPRSPKKYIGGTNIQIPLYLSAIMPLHKSIEPSDIEGQFTHIDLRGNSSDLKIDGHMLLEREDDFNKIVKAVISGISTSQFPPIPFSEKDCSRCEVASVCDYRSRKSAEYRMADLRVAKLVAAREVE